MYNKSKIIAIVILSVFLLMSSVSFGAENPTITYDGQYHEFFIKNVNHGDLFTTLKGLMPGDKITQNISIQTKHLDQETTLLLKSECDKESQEKLNQLQYYIEKDGKVICSAFSIEEPLLIGRFTDDSLANIKVVIEVPISVTEQITNMDYHLNWTFIAQEEGEVVAENPVQTGDNNSIALYAVIFLFAIIILIFILILKKKK